MAQLILQRAGRTFGMAMKIHCYVNQKRICQLKNGERTVCDVPDGVIGFSCRFSGTPMSDVFRIDLRGRERAYIDIAMEFGRVTVSVRDENGIPITPVPDAAPAETPPVPDAPQASAAFRPTKKVGRFFALDENTRRWAVGSGWIAPFQYVDTYGYDDILSFELTEDGDSVTTGGLGRAVAGYAFAGGLGAVVGGVTARRKTSRICAELTIRITLRNVETPSLKIDLISSPVKRGDIAYKNAMNSAQQILSLLRIICDRRDAARAEGGVRAESAAQPLSAADELRKFKALLDDGIITEEEFQAAKKRLLG